MTVESPPFGTLPPALTDQLASAATRPGLAERSLRQALVGQLILLLTVGVMAAPAATGWAAWVRWSFPGAAMLVGGWLFVRGRTGSYLTWCLWLFLLTPFVRRVVDGQAGYSKENVLMLAPYLAAAWTVLQAPRYLLTSGRPGQWPMAVLFATIAYGFALAVAAGRLLPGTVDLLRWSIPPLLACYLIVMAKDWRSVCLELRALTLIALPLISLYGLYQFVAPPYWDAIWMLNTKMNSIGEPKPFEIRVFSTMNSPASLAYYLMAFTLITVALKSRLRWLNVGLGIGALAVSLVRSAWLGLAIGLLLLMARAPLHARASVLAMLLASITLAPLALTNARVQRIVSDRIETLTNVAQDKSYLDRLKGYQTSIEEIAEKPWGEGFGVTNVAANYTQEKRVVDAGPVEIIVSNGVLFGITYLFMVGLLLIAAILRPPPPVNGDIYAAAVTIAIVQALALSSVTTVVGEIGVLFWLAIGLVLASPRSTVALRSLRYREVRAWEFPN